MAIIIEEEKNTGSILNILGWLVIFAMIAGAVYYIFFVSPSASVVLPSTTVNNVGLISQADQDAENIVNTPQFQAFKPYSGSSSTANSIPVGRSNPFASP